MTPKRGALPPMTLSALAEMAAAMPGMVWAAAALAGLVRGFAGFGAAMIFMPLASTAIPPAAAAATLLIVDGLLGMTMVPAALKVWNGREVAPLSLAATVMVPVGAWFLAVVDPAQLRWAVSVLALAAVMLLASGWRYGKTPGPMLSGAVGLVSGFLGGLSSYYGPPVVLFWLGGQAGHATVRANIIVFFGWTTIVAIITFTAYGLLNVSVFSRAALLFPVYGLAMILGARAFTRASGKVFRLAAYAIIVASALRGLPLLDGLF